jgi:hypothetical protein
MYKCIKIFILVSVFPVLFFSCSNNTNPVVGSPSTYTVTNNFKRSINKGIPTTDTLKITDSGSLLRLNFALDTAITVDGTQKLDVVLVHNNISDTIIKQFTNPTIPSYSFKGFVCDDSSEFILSPGLSNYSGNYKPYSPLSVFNNQSLSGPWYLVFSYPVMNKTGVIKSWSITVTYKTETPPISNINPLAVGNYWMFNVDTGNISNVYTAELMINESRTLHGKEVFKWQWQGSQHYWYIKAESDGLWWYGNYNGNTYVLDTTTPPFLWIKYPINQNEVFYTRQWIKNYDTLTCTGTNTTFYGYNGCVKYSENETYKADYNNSAFNFYNPDITKGTNTNIIGDFYFLPGTGYVGNEVTTKTPSSVNFQRYRLTSYHVQ